MEPILKIGLTYTGSAEKHNNYVNWITGDEQIEIVKLSHEDNNLDMVKTLDGIVMSGGVDVHPKFYSSDITDYLNAPEKFNEERDEFEKTVFEISRQQHIPLLGICRGMQLANCILGGTLIQDHGPDGNSIHRFDEIDKRHDIQIVPNTLLSEITGTKLTAANSAHHQAIDIAGEGLMVNSRSDDGTIEGVEWEDKTGKAFFLGVQWHPERMYKFGLSEAPAAKNIRDAFLNELKKLKEKTL